MGVERRDPKTPPLEVEYLLSVAIPLFLQAGIEGKGYAAHTIVDQAVKACSEYEPTMYAKGLVNAYKVPEIWYSSSLEVSGWLSICTS